MDKNLYSQIRKNWNYLHPLTKGLISLDYQLGKFFEEAELEYRNILKKENLKFFYWAPRITGIAFIIFLSSITIEVINWYNPLELIIDSVAAGLVPSFLMTLMLFLAWKNEFLGGFLFIMIFTAIFSLIIIENPLPGDLIFYGPLFIIGFLFLTDSYIRQIYGGKE